MKNKKELMKELIDTLENRNDLHSIYKEKQKDIISTAFACFIVDTECLNKDDIDSEFMNKWINDFVEERFIMEKLDDKDS